MQSNSITRSVDEQIVGNTAMITNIKIQFRNRSQKNSHNKCRQIRSWLTRILSKSLDVNAEWIQRHVTNCPKCQRRLASISKVKLALSIMKAQPQQLDLLMSANIQAIGMLKHSLQKTSKAEKLRTVLPEPKLPERLSKYSRPITNMAACTVILFLMKTGIFSSTNSFQSYGQKALQQYYINNVGQELANDIFTS
jgi:hypothetical protein